MKNWFLLLLATSALSAQAWQPNVSNARLETRPFSGDLAAQMKSAPTVWFGYAEKAVPAHGRNCCWNNGSECGCVLEPESGTREGVRRPGTVQLESSGVVAVLFRVTNNNVEKVQAYSLECPLDAGGRPVIWLTGVPSGASLDYLAKLAETGSGGLVDGTIHAISQHEDAKADGILERMTAGDRSDKAREQALFWLGASRGAAGLAALRRVLASDATDHIREKAVFALTVTKEPSALDTLIATAKGDRSSHVRGQALFWLAQKAGKQAGSAITEAIEKDPDTKVKERAVFALSQLPKDDGVPRLIEVARNNANAQVRKQAFFWLGQSGDPRALAFIEQVLMK
jgi:hypothetical protein